MVGVWGSQGDRNKSVWMQSRRSEPQRRTRTLPWRLGQPSKFELTISEEARHGVLVHEVARAQDLYGSGSE